MMGEVYSVPKFKRPVKSIASEPLKTADGYAISQMGKFLEKAGFTIDGIEKHKVTFEGASEHEYPTEWTSFTLSHPDPEKLKQRVLKAVRDGHREFFMETPSHRMDAYVVPSEDHGKFAGGKLSCPEGKVKVYLQAYGFTH